MNVISISQAREERQPHWEGDVLCVSCKHEWHCVAPIGTEWVECPNCGLTRGHSRYPFLPQKDDLVFTCNCGNDAMMAYFRAGRFRFQCLSCGVDHTDAVFND